MDSICLTLPSYWHNVLTAYIGSVFSQMLVNTFGVCVFQDKVYHVFFKVKLCI